MQEDTRRALSDLATAAARLAQYGFTEHALATGLGFHANRNESGQFDVVFDLPNEKERDASLLTFRLFLLRREAFSLYNLARLADDMDLSAGVRTGLHDVQTSFLDYLAGHPSQIESGFFEEDANPTRFEILDTVLNAALFHTNESAKRERYEQWCRDDVRASVLHQAFTRIVVSIMGMIQRASRLATDALAGIGPEGGAA